MDKVVKQLESLLTRFFTDLQVTSNEGSQKRNEISIVVPKALSQDTSLEVEIMELQKQRVAHALEPPAKHHPVHVVVHQELQAHPEVHALRGRQLPHAADEPRRLVLPRAAVLADGLAGEEGHGHDAAHLAPVLAVDREDHVLPFSREDVEDDVASARAELHALRVEHLLGERGGRDDHEVAHPHAEEEDVSVLLRQPGQDSVVEVVAQLEPIAE